MWSHIDRVIMEVLDQKSRGSQIRAVMTWSWVESKLFSKRVEFYPSSNRVLSYWVNEGLALQRKCRTHDKCRSRAMPSMKAHLIESGTVSLSLVCFKTSSVIAWEDLYAFERFHWSQDLSWIIRRVSVTAWPVSLLPLTVMNQVDWVKMCSGLWGVSRLACQYFNK